MHLKIRGQKSSKMVNLTNTFFEPVEVWKRGKKELITATKKAHDLALDSMGADLISYELYNGNKLITKYTDRRSTEAKAAGQSAAPMGCALDKSAKPVKVVRKSQNKGN